MSTKTGNKNQPTGLHKGGESLTESNVSICHTWLATATSDVKECQSSVLKIH
jgi:hypothetical protein